MNALPHDDWDPTDPKSTLALAERLQSDRAFRDLSGLFFVEGARSFVQALDAGHDVKAIVHSDRLLRVPMARQRVRERRRLGTPTHDVSPEEFRALSIAPRASGAGAIVAQRWSPLHKASPRAGLCWVVLEKIRSPGNFGTLVRTSEAVGGAGFVLVGPEVDPFDPAVLRASMGAHFRQEFVRTNPRSLGHWFRRHGCQVVGASPEGETEFHRFPFRRPTVLVLGEERKGLSPWQRALCTDLVRVPMVGLADSLNVGVAGSLLMYEAHRARSARRFVRS